MQWAEGHASVDDFTLMSSLPVPRMKPASVLPMPEANWPKAPALQVWESVPNSTSPAAPQHKLRCR